MFFIVSRRWRHHSARIFVRAGIGMVSRQPGGGRFEGFYVTLLRYEPFALRAAEGGSGKRISESITLTLKLSSAKLRFHLPLITEFRQSPPLSVKRNELCERFNYHGRHRRRREGP